MNRAPFVICLLVLLGSGCRQQPPRREVVQAPTPLEAKAFDQLTALGYVGQGQGGRGASANAPAAIAAMPAATPSAAPAPGPRLTSALKLIWSAALEVEVPNFRAAVDEASRAVGAFGGYVSNRQSSEDGAGRERGHITLRIPSQKFDGAMSALKKLGRVRSEGVQTQDVTKAYADLETRLKVKRETASRLREILIRQTGKVSEVLEVEREIGRVVEETEHAEGERLYFDNLIALSTITLSLFEPDSIVTPGALDPIFSALRRSLRTMSESLASLIELGSGLLPWLIAIYFGFRLAVWRWRRAQVAKLTPGA